ncbi:xylose ABC transporter ATP-binding protein [Luteibacter rhizovicinus]|uniref:Xylose ABC transporter ATP-binding protein n=1 Tax=Luteibacter rhizovicinus TaxID=242606 RepID=A0A4R3YU38_9GAMM|nr:xylose ABC transporter ATP-binding protein [Luteibacter rhizovicinus]
MGNPAGEAGFLHDEGVGVSEYLFEMRDIVKEFSGVRALNGINLAVRPGECVGLCGENGAGKSTLMKVLSGVYPYGTWEGEILWDGKPLHAYSVRDSEKAGIVIIHQELMLVPQLSVAENIFLGNEIRKFGGLMDYDAMYAKADALLARLKLKGVNVAAPVSNYGGGYQQLFEIAKALAKNARLLILDEPSSSLTSSETDTLLSIIEDLKREGVACVYISHKLEEVARVCDTVTVIRDGKHILTKPMSEMTTHSIITAMVGREIDNLFPKSEHHVGEVIFEARHVTCWDVANPNRKRVDDVSFELRRGEILGIAGLVGAGRTELVSAIFGAYPGRSTAELVLEGKPIKVTSPQQAIRAGLSLVPEDRKRQGIVPLLGVGDNITLATLQHYSHAGRIDRAAELQTVEAEIKRLRVKTASPELAIAGLSGGNQQKAVLTKMLLPNPKVLILDEPTRGVDVGSKFDIYTLMFELAAKGVSIIMVSSEMPEVLGVSDRVLVMGEGKLKGNFPNVGLTQEQVLAAAIDSAAATPNAA